MAMVYFFVGLFASIIGSIAGLGGGIIIKPTLDLLGHYNIATISVLSVATVFSMAAVSLLRSLSVGIKVKGKTSFILAFGSIIGGVIGNILFNYVVNLINSSDLITAIQSGVLASLMCIIFMFVRNKGKIKSYIIKNVFVICLIGIVLGLIAAFLGIGGGPLNMAILALGFSMTTKDAAINSIFIIFFSQLASLLITAYNTSFVGYDLSMLVYMIFGGVIGGFIGSGLSFKFTIRKVELAFNSILIVIFLLNLYNMFANFFLFKT